MTLVEAEELNIKEATAEEWHEALQVMAEFLETFSGNVVITRHEVQEGK